MYKNLKIISIAPVWNEQQKIEAVVRRVPRDVVDEILVVDDGSTDESAKTARNAGANVISLGKTCGVGFALRAGLAYAREHQFDVAVILAGNNKDDPSEIPLLLDPIAGDKADLVIGSRFLKGGGYGGDMPAYRKLATRVHPWLMSLFLRKQLTESTNGFRAVRLTALDDQRLKLSQTWLDGYALEVYLLFKLIRLGYRHVEVPCTKIYPPKRLGNTKMRPVLDWWDILRPVIYLGVGLRK